MKVLFIAVNSIYEHEDSEFLGYEILIACLKQHKVDADILQIEYRDRDEDLSSYIHKEDLDGVAIIGINCMYPTYQLVKSLCQSIKDINKEIHITIGGALPTVEPIDSLKLLQDADSVIIGEGERTICDLYNIVINQGNLSECKGIAYRINREIYLNSSRELIKDLDEIPFAERVMLERNRYQFARIQTSRGCEGHCVFCSESHFLNDDTKVHWRGRSPKNIVDELEYIVKKYSVTNFIFCDSSFEDPCRFGRARMLEICDEIEKRGLKIHFRVLFRSESVAHMDDILLNRLREAGLFHVFLGVESGYEPTLRLFHKRATTYDNSQAIKKIRKNKFNLTTGFIMFHPYTSIEEINENLEFIINNKLEFSAYSFISKMAVHKGTLIYEKVKEDGLLLHDYSLSNPYAYRFMHEELGILHSKLRECFNIINASQLNHLVSLITYLEDDIRKFVSYTGITERYNSFLHSMDCIRDEIGKYQLELFLYLKDINNAKQEVTDKLVKNICKVIERKLKELNDIHREWMRIKIKCRIK